jgi:hypothetical protein
MAADCNQVLKRLIVRAFANIFLRYVIGQEIWIHVSVRPTGSLRCQIGGTASMRKRSLMIIAQVKVLLYGG